MRVIFIHPDLGIGGAERLVVDAGVAVTQLGHSVHFLTSHHDSDHCFRETKDGTLPVTVVGDWFPRSFWGKCHAFCAYFRMLLVVLYLLFFAPEEELRDYDLIVCDQISAPIPLIKWFGHIRNKDKKKPKIVFYCHFPDQLLTQRQSLAKRVYRWPIDWLEEWSTGSAHCVLVNSGFTAKVFRKTFLTLSDVPLQVLYPTVNFAAFDRQLEGDFSRLQLDRSVSTVFLSVNRFERKKNLQLAIEAMAVLKKQMPLEAQGTVHLLMVGGYDERVAENREHFLELIKFAAEREVGDQVTLLKSPSDAQKHLLLHSCTAVIYTPENEHFGIVPLEAMYMKKPVIACSSGGPLETVRDSETGFLCESLPEAFAAAMMRFVRDKSLARELGISGHEHVKQNFSYEAFKTQLNNVINRLHLS